MNTYNLKIYVVISDFPYEDTIINSTPIVQNEVVDTIDNNETTDII